MHGPKWLTAVLSKYKVFVAVSSFHRYIIYILLKTNFRLITPDNVGENKEGQAFGY